MMVMLLMHQQFDGSVYQVKMGNGTLNHLLIQGNPDNTDILTGKIVRGKQS